MRLRQENPKFKDHWDFIVRPCLKTNKQTNKRNKEKKKEK
jgi:hypothetical protein